VELPDPDIRISCSKWKYSRQPTEIDGAIKVIALLQRVAGASVSIGGAVTASIGSGLLALVGIRPVDTEESALRLLARMLQYRIFADEAGKMNLSLRQTQGGLLLVPQFTLAADTRKGLRPGFSGAAPPEQAQHLFEVLLRAARAQHGRVESGVFGANMQLSLTNDGPVTIWLES
jgi:D-tyrosyl-tRNA(Tyr) deacylase